MRTAIINMLYTIISTVMSWWNAIIAGTDMAPLWGGAVVIVMLFSIVLTPMRGGQLLGGGAIGTFAKSKIHNQRKSKPNTGDD